MPWLRGSAAGSAGSPSSRRRAEPATGYAPDFLTPAPAGPLGRIADDSPRCGGRRSTQIRHEIELFRRSTRDAGLGAWLAHPRREVRRLADTLEALLGARARARVARIRAFLDADIPHRAHRLALGGPAALFADLHPGSAGPTTTSTSKRPQRDDRARRPRPGADAVGVRGAPGHDRQRAVAADLIYPARGIATLWDEGGGAGRARPAARRTRAAVLADLDAPRSTTDVAQRLRSARRPPRTISRRCGTPGSSPRAAKAATCSTSAPPRRRAGRLAAPPWVRTADQANIGDEFRGWSPTVTGAADADDPVHEPPPPQTPPPRRRRRHRVRRHRRRDHRSE